MSAYEDACNYFENAARVIDLSANMKKLLLTPEREVKVQVAMKMDNGESWTISISTPISSNGRNAR